jgi:hypothetical protein
MFKALNSIYDLAIGVAEMSRVFLATQRVGSEDLETRRRRKIFLLRRKRR